MGHLRGCAEAEWNLLGEDEVCDFETAIRNLKERLDPCSKVLAGQDFRGQSGPLLLEDCCDSLDLPGLVMERSLFHPNDKGEATLTILNTSGFTEKMSEGTVVGKAVEAQQVDHQTTMEDDDGDAAGIKGVKQVNFAKGVDTAKLEWRKNHLLDMVGKFDLSPEGEVQMRALIGGYNDVFALEDGERGETDLVQLEIETMQCLTGSPHVECHLLQGGSSKTIEKDAGHGRHSTF